MTLEQEILDALRGLRADKQREVLNYAKHLRSELGQKHPPRKCGRGLWADLQIDLTAEDIEEARREMWKNFRRNNF
jgi:hypothetical protein